MFNIIWADVDFWVHLNELKRKEIKKTNAKFNQEDSESATTVNNYFNRIAKHRIKELEDFEVVERNAAALENHIKDSGKPGIEKTDDSVRVLEEKFERVQEVEE